VKRTLSVYSVLFLLLAGIGSVLFCSCGSGNGPGDISEGVIEYNAEVVDKSHPMAGLAPSTMSMYFKNNLYCSEMSTMGMFNSKFIANPNTKTFTTMVKILNEKSACIEGDKEIKADQEKFKLLFEETKETKMIAGYKCKKLKATSASDPSDKFDVYYTTDLDVKNPNYSTPYEGLKGLVMQFRLEKFGMEMEFTAKTVKKEDVPDATFELPGYYKIVSPKEIAALFDFMK
jgi:GLPGLI family protein